MLAAVRKGDTKELAELMRQDPGFKVNQQDEDGWTLLHYACYGQSRSAVIPLLLAHPDIDPNVKTKYGDTPFFIPGNIHFSSPKIITNMSIKHLARLPAD